MKLLPVGNHRCRHRPAILHPKSPQNISCILPLSKENMSRLLPNLHAQIIVHQPYISHLKLLCQVSLAMCNETLSTGDEQIINIQQKNKCLPSNHNEVEVGISLTLLKSHGKKIVINPGVPSSRSLFESVQSFLQSAYMRLPPMYLKSKWLLKID